VERPHPCSERQDEKLTETGGVFRKVQQTRLHPRKDVDHAEAVIEQNADRGIHIFPFKDCNLLLDAVLVDSEVSLVQTRDESPSPVLGGQDDVDEIYVNP
jgi:hypothetical protein